MRAEAETALVNADRMQRELEERGRWNEARKLAVQCIQVREQLKNMDSTALATARSRPSAPAEDPRLAKMNALVASVTGADRKRVNKLIGSTVHVGVPEDYQPR